MATKQAIIYGNYQTILKQNNGAQFVKVDLHVHTPASGDARAKNKYNFKFDLDDPDRLIKAEKLAEEIVQHCVDEKIRLIAITDHNSPSMRIPATLDTHSGFYWTVIPVLGGHLFSERSDAFFLS